MALCGVLGAYTLNFSAARALSQTEAFISLVRFLRSEIECFSMPLPRVIERCPQDTLAELGAPPSCADLYELVSLCDVSDRQTAEIMRRFAGEVGKGYREEQLLLCDYYLSLLEERRGALASALPQRRRMNTALCVAGALAVVIVLV